MTEQTPMPDDDGTRFDDFLMVQRMGQSLAGSAARLTAYAVQAIYDKPWGGETPDSWYRCCVQQIGFARESLDTLEKWAKERIAQIAEEVNDD